MLELKKIYNPDYVTPIIELNLQGLPVALFATDDFFNLRCEVNPDFATKEISIKDMPEIVVLIANSFRKDVKNVNVVYS